MAGRRQIRVLGAGTVALALLAAGCSGAGGSSGTGADTTDAAGASGSTKATSGQSINVLMVGNPQMEDLQKLTADGFTKASGIKVNFTILPENELRDKVTQDIATQAGQYDVATIGAYEANNWAGNDWLTPLDSYEAKDTAFDAADLLKPMTESLTVKGKLYAMPFYGESSFLMYRKDLFEQAGITMPAHPTWTQVAGYAKKLNGIQKDVSGICLRGLAGWGEVFAPLTTVVNTFGGTWFNKDWSAGLDSPEFKAATNLYVDTVKNYGEKGASQAGFTECLNSFGQGKSAMWYDATSAAGSLEDPATSKVVGKVGYAFAPVEKTKSSGWLWTWAWGMPKTTKKADAAWKFISWASSKDYEKLVGDKLGYARVPSGKRASTYKLPEYQKAAAAFYQVTLDSIEAADPTNPGLQPRPTTGVQFVAIPEFADLGTKVAQEVSAAIAGRTSVDKALSDGQKLATDVGNKYK